MRGSETENKMRFIHLPELRSGTEAQGFKEKEGNSQDGTKSRIW